MLNSHLIQQRHNINAHKLKELDFIYREVATRMISRLDYIKFIPSTILDIGSGLGIDSKLLHQRFPQALLIQLDLALNMLKHNSSKPGLFNKILGNYIPPICANTLNLPIKSQSIDMVWSNLCLPYIDNLELYFKEINRVLQIGGYFLVTGLSVDSLLQLREVGLQTFNFPDMHIIGDILVKLGFTHSVTDIEYINLEYDNFEQLLNDVRIIGCGSAISSKLNFSRQDYHKLKERFAKITHEGKTPLTLEIYYAHAWKEQTSLNLSENKKIVQFYPKPK
ncbi:MAG: methyltransferase domain-containing protein [Burkholderiales bacterium]|nr:methyltransferase domain-containing protein [Burkholderiales bacterium]